MIKYSGAEIKEMRHKLGYSQQEFASELGVSMQSVHRWETGKAKPSRMAMKLLDKICEEVR